MNSTINVLVIYYDHNNDKGGHQIKGDNSRHDLFKTKDHQKSNADNDN